jgi:di/tricarboxylate transporter
MAEDIEAKITKKSTEDPLLLEYDYLKHISTLSLATLGGILSISKLDEKASQLSVALAIALVAVGGALALMCGMQIVVSRRNDKPLSRWFRAYSAAATGLFMGGIGVFLGIFSRNFF